ncbi:MAG: hypothetical protein IKV97_01180 [Clostridia bacterium]|nr:hypothetical protein [Clostridia bacterium]
MFINIGSNKLIRKKNIVGIFDLDTASHEKETRDFLKNAEKKGTVEMIGSDLPKAFIVASGTGTEKIGKKNSKKKNIVYLTTLSSSSLAGRARHKE